MPVSVALVNMPFAAPYRPSIQCGLLKSLLSDAGHHVDVYYPNLDLLPILSTDFYLSIAEGLGRVMLGEWLFSAAAFGPFDDGVDHFARIAGHLGIDRKQLTNIRSEILPAWLDQWTTRIDWGQYQFVGFSCTYQQTNAAIALAARIKARYGTTTLFGGSAFDAHNAQEFVRDIPAVDYLLLGDADRTLPEFTARLERREALDGIPGLLTKANPEGAAPPQPFTEMDSLPDPDYTEYFQALADNELRDTLAREVRIPFEGSRGCWWGQRHHCTFCGMPEETMVYRKRSPERVLAELDRQAARHRNPMFFATDSILDLDYLKNFFPRIAESRLDYQFFFETKANLTREQLRILVNGGVRMIQPGIESLSSRVLRLMNKGTTMALNVRLLKWAQYYGLRVGWNILTGFPGETIEDYTSQIRLARLLRHLPPPTTVNDFLLERSAMYPCEDGEYFKNVRPMQEYALTYPPTLNLTQIAGCFDTDRARDPMIPKALAELQDAVAEWREMRRRPKRPLLIYRHIAGAIEIDDRRDPNHPHTRWLNGKDAELYILCSETGQTMAAIDRHFNDAATATTVRELTEAGLLIEDEGRLLSLALPINRNW